MTAKVDQGGGWLKATRGQEKVQMSSSREGVGDVERGFLKAEKAPWVISLSYVVIAGQGAGGGLGGNSLERCPERYFLYSRLTLLVKVRGGETFSVKSRVNSNNLGLVAIVCLRQALSPAGEGATACPVGDGAQHCV